MFTIVAIKHSKADDVELLWQRAGLHQQLGQRPKAMDDYELVKKARVMYFVQTSFTSESIGLVTVGAAS